MGSKSGSGSATGRGGGSAAPPVDETAVIPSYVQYSTVAEYRTAIAEQFGVRLDFRTTDPRTAAMGAYNALARMQAQGLPLPKTINRVNRPSAGYAAFHEHGVDGITVNVGHPVWTDVMTGRRLAGSGWLTDASFEGIITHEIGHNIHLGPRPASEVRSMMGAKGYSGVSRYAESSQTEFVAETFAGLVRGNTYSSDVMSKYNQLGGPRVKTWRSR